MVLVWRKKKRLVTHPFSAKFAIGRGMERTQKRNTRRPTSISLGPSGDMMNVSFKNMKTYSETAYPIPDPDPKSYKIKRVELQ